MEEEYLVHLTDDTYVSVWGYTVLDAKNYAIEVYGNRFVSIAKKKGER